jgi:hypothetical protein
MTDFYTFRQLRDALNEWCDIDDKWQYELDTVNAKWRSDWDAVNEKVWRSAWDAVNARCIITAKWKNEQDALHTKRQLELNVIEAKIETYIRQHNADSAWNGNKLEFNHESVK